MLAQAALSRTSCSRVNCRLPPRWSH